MQKSNAATLAELTMWQPPSERYFPIPNDIFLVGLSPGAFTVYGYLMFRENRRTYQCHPSYRDIGSAVSMCENTVRKYVGELEEKGVISTAPTSVMTAEGLKLNGALLYTMQPIQKAVDLRHTRMLARADTNAERRRAQIALAKQDWERKVAALVEERDTRAAEEHEPEELPL